MLKREKFLAGTIRVFSYRILPYILILLPVALGFFYVYLFGVNVVFADQWQIVPLFDKLSAGTLGISDLFAQHLEHKIFFPRVAMLLLGSITKYDTVAEMYLIQTCLLLTLIVLLLAFKHDIKTTSYLFVPVAFMVFSFRQAENMLWGFQMTFVFVQTFGVLALYLLHISSHRRLVFLGALGSATVASFSSLPGLLVWLAGLLQLLISPAERRKVFLVTVWGLVGVGVWIVYFFNYVNPNDLFDLVEPNRPPVLLSLLGNPAATVQYFLILLGSSLFWDLNLALGGGFLLACLCGVSLILILRDKKSGEYSFWIGLLTLSFLILAAVMAGRAGFGIDGALGSRYASFSILTVVGVYLMLVKLALEKQSMVLTALLSVIMILMLLGAVQSYSRGVEFAKTDAAGKEKIAKTLLTYEEQPYERLYRIYPLPARGTEAPGLERNKEILVDLIEQKGAPTLKKLGYNVFSEQ